MEDKNKSFNTKKYVAIAFMAAAFLLLCTNWLKLGSETRDLIDEAKEELEDDLDREMSYWDVDDLEELYDEEGYSTKEIKKMVKATEAMFDLMDKAEKGRFSVFTLMGVHSDLSTMKPAMADEDLTGSDSEEMTIGITVVQVLLFIIIVVFIVNGASMLFAIFCYITEKKAFGVISAVLSGLKFIGFGAIMLFIKIGSEDLGTGITFSPILTFICCLVSCIVWRSARKMLEQQNMYNQYPPYQNGGYQNQPYQYPPYQNGGYQNQPNNNQQ